MVCKCVVFLNHFLSLISFPSSLPFPGTWDLFQVATTIDAHRRTKQPRVKEISDKRETKNS